MFCHLFIVALASYIWERRQSSRVFSAGYERTTYLYFLFPHPRGLPPWVCSAASDRSFRNCVYGLARSACLQDAFDQGVSGDGSLVQRIGCLSVAVAQPPASQNDPRERAQLFLASPFQRCLSTHVVRRTFPMKTITAAISYFLPRDENSPNQWINGCKPSW